MQPYAKLTFNLLSVPDQCIEMESRTIHELNIAPAKMGRVIVVGGGFGGLSVAQILFGNDLQVVIIDRNNYHQFQPLLYQVATSGLEPTAISFPIRGILRDYRDVHFRMATVTAVDTKANIVHTTIGDLSYDYLVLAAGADTNYFGNKNIEQNSLPLKSISEALALRNQIYRTMEAAIDIEDQEERQPYLNFVIVGGGPTGVELSGAVVELRNKILPRDYPGIDFTKMRVILMNAGGRLLDTFSEKSSEQTLLDLQAMGVEVMLNTKVTDYNDNTVYYNDGQALGTRNLVWASGVIANKIPGIENLGRGARITVNDYNLVDGLDNVYAVGDQAIMSSSPHPQVAQVAMQQGQLVAKNILRHIRNQPQQPFKYIDKGSMATIGRNRAVVELKNLKLNGFIAWLMWLFVHLLFIIGVRNRFTVMWDWAWSYITREQPLRSIIVARRKSSDTN